MKCLNHGRIMDFTLRILVTLNPNIFHIFYLLHLGFSQFLQIWFFFKGLYCKSNWFHFPSAQKTQNKRLFAWLVLHSALWKLWHLRRITVFLEQSKLLLYFKVVRVMSCFSSNCLSLWNWNEKIIQKQALFHKHNFEYCELIQNGMKTETAQ